MKKHILLICCAAMVALLSSCYSDKGGNDFDTAMADVEINLPETAYSGSLGETITITPEVKTDIPESDLQYIWEVQGARHNAYGRNAFMPLLPDADQGRTLNYVCKLDSNIVTLNTSYTCRLHVRQISTSRDFYSSETFTVTIVGLTGLLVLHGDDSTSDVGILEADEFTPAANTLPGSPKATPHLYSSVNGGTIAGKGEQVLQSITNYANMYHQTDRCRIYVKTSSKALFANMSDLSYYGDWDKMFYLTGDRKVNSGVPRGYMVEDQLAVAFDGDDMFLMSQSQQYPFLFPEITPETVCGDGNTFVLAPHLLRVASNGVQVLAYSDKVNGSEQKGFIAMQQFRPENTVRYVKLIDTKSDKVPFNPGNMKASLVKMNVDSRGHVLAVLKGDDSNPDYPGQFFAVDIYPNASAAGESSYAGVPQYAYRLASMTDISNAFAFEFGSSKNMCYYATPSGVYQYGVDGSTLYPAAKLNMVNGTELNIEGKITMMKMLNSPNVSTHNTDAVLLVATWNDGSSSLYALHLSNDTGKVTKAVKYDSSTVQGWDFGHIYDVNIKGL